MIELWKKAWFRSGTAIILLLLLGGSFFYHILKFSSLDQADPWSLQRLPSNELIDLYDRSLTPIKTVWIYPFVDIYYQGRILLIPEDLLNTLDLSPELLLSRGRLADAVPKEMNASLHQSELEMVLGLDSADLRMANGRIYTFITEETDPNIPLLLLKNGNQFFFIPANLLPDREVGQ